MNLEQLQQQLASLQLEAEQGKAQFYRAEGAIALVKLQIQALEDAPSKTAEEIKKKG